MKKVKNRNTGMYYFEYEDGSRSEDFFWIGWDGNDKNSIEVKKYKDSLYQFMDRDGNLSLDSYFMVESYNFGYSVVQVKDGGPQQYRDMKGNLSEEFDEANTYFGGYGVVRLKGSDEYRYRDTNGNLSQAFKGKYDLGRIFVKGKVIDPTKLIYSEPKLKENELTLD